MTLQLIFCYMHKICLFYFFSKRHKCAFFVRVFLNRNRLILFEVYNLQFCIIEEAFVYSIQSVVYVCVQQTRLLPHWLNWLKVEKRRH